MNERWMGEVDEKLDGISKKLDCLPAVVDKVTRHDEQIQQLRAWVSDISSRQWWLVGIFTVALLGAIAKVCAG